MTKMIITLSQRSYAEPRNKSKKKSGHMAAFWFYFELTPQPTSSNFSTGDVLMEKVFLVTASVIRPSESLKLNITLPFLSSLKDSNSNPFGTSTNIVLNSGSAEALIMSQELIAMQPTMDNTNKIFFMFFDFSEEILFYTIIHIHILLSSLSTIPYPL